MRLTLTGANIARTAHTRPPFFDLLIADIETDFYRTYHPNYAHGIVLLLQTPGLQFFGIIIFFK